MVVVRGNGTLLAGPVVCGLSAGCGTRKRSLWRRSGVNEETTLSIASLRLSPMCMYLMW